MRTLLIALSFLVSTVAIAAPKMAPAAKTPAVKAEGFNLIHVSDLDGWMKKKDSVFIFDANNDKVRTADGMIPGAKPLPTAGSYDVAKTLPMDHAANLVFYCANTECMASHDAAKRAVNAGYKHVSVMADGIQGWVKAGKPTEKMAANKAI